REGHAPTAERLRGARDRLGRCLVGERVHLARLRDVPVLTELAREVAARGPERQHRRSGEEVIERLLLDRVDAVSTRATVRGEHDLPALGGAHEAETALALVELARARTDVALDAAVGERVPVLRGDGGRGRHPSMVATVRPRGTPRCFPCAGG